MVVIKDNRDGRIFLCSKEGIVRLFETVLERNITESKALKKYPKIIKVKD